jgi:hypothetical protein
MTLFRNWVHCLWLENCEEKVLYGDGNSLTEQEYFQRFKWWLRREYRHQANKELRKEKINERQQRLY